MPLNQSKPTPETGDNKTGGLKPVRTTATIMRNTAPELNFEWYLQVNQNEQVVPTNLKDQLKVPNTVVDVAYIPTTKTVKSSKGKQIFLVEIVDITVVKQIPKSAAE